MISISVVFRRSHGLVHVTRSSNIKPSSSSSVDVCTTESCHPGWSGITWRYRMVKCVCLFELSDVLGVLYCWAFSSSTLENGAGFPRLFLRSHPLFRIIYLEFKCSVSLARKYFLLFVLAFKPHVGLNSGEYNIQTTHKHEYKNSPGSRQEDAIQFSAVREWIPVFFDREP